MLIIETGYFSESWAEMADTLGIKVEALSADWRKGPEFSKLAERLATDKAHEIKAVLTVHNETATGMVLPVAEIRRAIDEAKHPALLLSDTISSLASMEYKMDAWGIDVTVAGSQKGLMLPTGMSITGVSKKAHRRVAQEQAAELLLELGADGRPRAAALHRHRAGPLLLRPAPIDEADRRGDLDAVFPRHARLAEATRAAVRAWGGEGNGPTLYGQTQTGSPIR